MKLIVKAWCSENLYDCIIALILFCICMVRMIGVQMPSILLYFMIIAMSILQTCNWLNYLARQNKKKAN